MNGPKRSAPGTGIAGATKLRVAQTYQFCFHSATRTEEMRRGHTHHAREVCTGCGAFIRWLPSPRAIERRKLDDAMLAKLLTAEGLSTWEAGFVESLTRQKKFSPKQEQCLGQLYRRYFGGPALP